MEAFKRALMVALIMGGLNLWNTTAFADHGYGSDNGYDNTDYYDYPQTPEVGRYFNGHNEDIDATYLKTVTECSLSSKQTTDMYGYPVTVSQYCYLQYYENRGHDNQLHEARIWSPTDGYYREMHHIERTGWDNYLPNPVCFWRDEYDTRWTKRKLLNECNAARREDFVLIQQFHPHPSRVHPPDYRGGHGHPRR